MKLKQLVEKCEMIAAKEKSKASDILANELFSESYNYNSFSGSELQAIIQELSSCYGCHDKDLIDQLKEYHSELFED